MTTTSVLSLAEVESVLLDHPAVSEVAVIGLTDHRWGEAVVAVVALRPDTTVTLDQLRDFAAERLARYKLPSRLETVPVLPRNPAGNVLTFDLRQRFHTGCTLSKRPPLAGRCDCVPERSQLEDRSDPPDSVGSLGTCALQPR